MNILFVTKELPHPVNNGHRMRSINILKGIAEGNTIDIVCMGQEDQMSEAKVALKSYYRNLIVVPMRPDDLPYKLWTLIKSIFSYRAYSVLLRHCQKMRTLIEELCENNNYDCIVSDGIHMMVNIPNTGTKTILSEHNIESMIIKRYADVATGIKKWFADFEHRKMSSYEELTWARSDAAFVCSEDDKKYVCEVMPSDEVFVVPNGVDVDNYEIRKGVTKVANSLIYTGLMGWAPNEDAVCYFAEEIYPLIKKEIPDARFSIVGKGPKERVMALANKDRSIHVTGFVDDIQKYMCEADVFVVPIRIGSGTRLKILEALSLQMTIVSTSIGCEGIEVTNGENILIKDSPQGFADAVVDVFKNRDKYKDLGVNGRKLVEKKYSWTKVRQDLSEYLRQLNN